MRGFRDRWEWLSFVGSFVLLGWAAYHDSRSFFEFSFACLINFLILLFCYFISPIFAKPSEYMKMMIEGDNEKPLRRNKEI